MEKYLKHYKLSSSGTKADKIRKISLHVLGADEGGGKHADDKSLNKATEMLEDVCEGENEESSSEDDIVLAELTEASDCDSEQGTAGSSTQQDYSLHASDKLWSVFQSDSEEEEFHGFSEEVIKMRLVQLKYETTKLLKKLEVAKLNLVLE